MSDYSVQAILSAKDTNFTSTFEKALGTADSFGSKLKSGLSFGFVTAAGQAAFNVIGKGFSAVTSHMDSAIDRVDTLNQFPRVLSLMGIEASEADEAMGILSDGIDGLPTALDEIAGTAQNLTVLTGDAKKSAKAAVALNDAFLMSGSSAADASRGMTQYSQMLAKGKVDQQSWNTLVESMGPALQRVAESFGYTGASARTDLYEALKAGDITFDQFQDKLIELDEGLDGFAAVAKEATKGIKTSMKNVSTAVTKNLANMIDKTDKIWQASGKGIADHFDTLKQNINTGFKGLMDSKMFTAAATSIGNVVTSLENRITAFSSSIGTNLDKVYDYFQKFTPQINSVKAAFKEAFDGIKEAVGPDFLSNLKTDALQMLTSAIDTTCSKLKEFAGWINQHKDTIAKFLPHLPKLIAGYAGLQVAGNFLPYAKKFTNGAKLISGSVGGMASGISGMVSHLTALPGQFTKVGSSFTSKVTGVIGSGLTSLTGKFPGLGTAAQSASEAAKGGLSSLSNLIHKEMGPGVDIAMKGFSSSISAGTKEAGFMFQALGGTIQAGLSILGPGVLVALVLAAMGGMNMAFGDQITQMCNTAITQGPQIITSLANGISSAIPGLVMQGAMMMAQLMNVVTANFPALVSSGLQIVGSLVSGLIQSLPTLIPAALSMVTTIITSLITGIPQLIIMGMQLLQGLVHGVVDNIDQVTSSGEQIINTIVTAITTNLPTIVAIGLDILSNLATGIVNALPQLIVAGLLGIATLIQSICSMLPTILQTGVQILGQLVDGIINNLPQILSAAAQVILSLIQGILQALPAIIVSGTQIVAKLVSGIIQAIPAIASAGWDLIKKLGSSIAEAIPNIIPAALEGLGSIFGGVADGLAGVWNKICGDSDEGAAAVAEDFNEMGTAMQESTAQATQETGLQYDSFFDSLMNDAAYGTDAMWDFSAQSSSALEMTGGVADTTMDDYMAMFGGMMDASTQGSDAVWDFSTQASTALDTASVDASSFLSDVTSGFDSTYESCLTNAGSAAEMFAQMQNNAFASTSGSAATETGSIMGDMASLCANMSTSASSSQTDLSSLGESFSSLSNTAAAAMGDFNTEVSTAMSTMGSAMRSGLSSMNTAASTGFNKMKSTIQSASISMTSTVKTMTNQMKSTVTAGMNSMSSAVKSGMNSMKSAVTSGMNSIKSAVTSGMNGAKSSVTSGMNSMRSTTSSAMSSMRSSVSSACGSIRSSISSCFSSLPGVASSGMAGVTNAIRGCGAPAAASYIASAVVANLSSASSGAYYAGTMIGAGLANGMNAMAGAVWAAAASLAAAASTAIAARAAIGSPSKITTQYGRWIGEGLGNGILDEVSFVKKASDKLVSIPDLASGPDSYMRSYSQSLSLEEEGVYTRNNRYVIDIPVSIDGREVAKATYEFNQEEQDRKERRERRKRGIA